MQALKDLKNTIAYKWTGNKYHDSLTGDSLLELLRQATSKALESPDITINQLVCEKINDEVARGKDSLEVVQLLKDRLRQNNPRKQWLALKLLELIMDSCQESMGNNQGGLLQEVARVMYEPARAETEEGKRVRFTAKELLRKYGQAGTNAFRAVHVNHTAGVFAGPPNVPISAADAATFGVAQIGHPPGPYPAPQSYYPPTGYPVQGSESLNGTRAQLQDEVKQLIDKSKSNAELLSDMILNASSNSDDFESDLIKDLLVQCRELREILNGYLEKLAVQSGAAMEQLIAQTLEAADALDSAISLQKDIHLGLAAERATSYAPAPPPAPLQQAAASSTSSYPTYGQPAPQPAPKVNNDLIALDDLFGAMSTQPAPQAASYQPQQANYGAPAAPPIYSAVVDPFAASYAAPPPPPMYAAPPQPAAAAHFPPSPPKPAASAVVDPFASLSPLPPSIYTPPPPMVSQPAAPPGTPIAPSTFLDPPAFSPPNTQFPLSGFTTVPYNNDAFEMAPVGGAQPALSASNPFISSNPFMQQGNNPFIQAAGPAPTQQAFNPPPSPPPSAAVDQEWAHFFAQPKQ